MTGDGRYLRVSGITLEDHLAANGLYPKLQPGFDGPLDLKSEKPIVGSCLLYGNNGTAAKPGSLGPDKIVFRDGWDPDNSYLTLISNLADGTGIKQPTQ